VPREGLFRRLGEQVPVGRTTDASLLYNSFIINYLLIHPLRIPSSVQVASRGVKVPANDSGLRVNLSDYLNAGCRALPGLARGAPGASIGIGEKQVSILIAPAGGAVHGPGGFGGGDDFIQPEETHQEDSHERNRNQEVPPAGLQDGILHLRLQMLR